MAGVKGRSGRAERPWAAALKLALNEVGPDGKRKLRRLAEVAVNMALAGDIEAIKMIGERLDGKPPVSLAEGEAEPFAAVMLAGFEAAAIRAREAMARLVGCEPAPVPPVLTQAPGPVPVLCQPHAVQGRPAAGAGQRHARPADTAPVTSPEPFPTEWTPETLRFPPRS